MESPNVNQGVSLIRPPAIEAPAGKRCVIITRPHGLMLGSRWCAEGEIIRVTPQNEMSARIYPIDDRCSESRARELVSKKLAKWHDGPPTHNCHSPPPYETLGIAIEAAIAPPRDAERALAPRQGGKSAV